MVIIPNLTRAAAIPVAQFNKGDVFRIADPDHPRAGQSGTLEFEMNGAAWLRIDGEDVPVSVKNLVLVRRAP